ncbi:DUF2314 domain-containing protein [Paenibacillus elgii]
MSEVKNRGVLPEDNGGNKTMTDIFFAEESPKMLEAYKKAQETFKYFWRELSWEYRRIIPALDVACVKVRFSQIMEDNDTPTVEHMWVNEIDFDGENIKGILINEPNLLTNIKVEDTVIVPLSQISDWLFTQGGITFGGFTIQAARSEMSDNERKEHDEAWGLDFGDYNDIWVVTNQQKYPENLEEHPMSKNMREKLIEFLQQNPGELTSKDDLGNTLLHRESIAGNRTSVEVLLQLGVAKNAKNKNKKTALDYAKQLNWENIIPILE